MKLPKFIVKLLTALIVVSIAFLYVAKRLNDAPKIKLTLPNRTSYAAYSHNGQLLATINGNNLDIWDADTGNKLHEVQTPTTIAKAIFSKQSEHLITVSTEITLHWFGIL